MPINYKKYPPNWKTEIVPAVLARSNNCCEWEGCSFVNGQFVYRGLIRNKIEWFATLDEAIAICGKDLVFTKPVKVVLTVAHLDHDETNHTVELDRLKAMCQLHHLRYDAKEKFRRQKVNWENKSKETKK